MKARDLRPFDVLKNVQSGELGLVIEIAGDKVNLADQTGQRAFFKLGALFEKMDNEQCGAFRIATLFQMRERRKLEAPKKRRASKKKAAPAP
ncbi:MAG: hypothetical protein SF051_03635 [Elusimicrobiota bacterium]|nr:hypothetical protein [Elusimicrobiota bacterium]